MSAAQETEAPSGSRGPLVLVGGYGVVGAQIAEILARRHPDQPIIVAGRSEERARQSAASLPTGRGAAIDVSDAAPLRAIEARAGLVVSAVNDPDNNLMRDAIRRGFGYLDIARWTERLKSAVFEATTLAPRAPVVFASSWMAGVPGLYATHLARDLSETRRIDLSILYALKDKAGPNSIEYADQLDAGFDVLENGEWRTVRALSEPRDVTFSSGRKMRARRFSTPDLEILPRLTGAKTVGVRLSYDDPGAAGTMAFLVRSGIWGAMSGRWFDGLRRALLYNPGGGAAHEILIEIGGRDREGRSVRLAATVRDPLGQTHMTAAGAVVQIERIWRLSGQCGSSAPIRFAESHDASAHALAALREMGVDLSVAAAQGEGA